VVESFDEWVLFNFFFLNEFDSLKVHFFSARTHVICI